jgi:hypothetical protein
MVTLIFCCVGRLGRIYSHLRKVVRKVAVYYLAKMNLPTWHQHVAKADIWVCHVGTPGDTFLHHVGNMLANILALTFHVCLFGPLADTPTSDISS